ncbi:MAG: MlaE family ABC transporter permease [Myxococcota bacterium]
MRARAESTPPWHPVTVPSFGRLRARVERLGGMVLLLGNALVRAVTPPFRWGETAYQVVMLGNRSLSIAGLVALFAGLVLTLQFAVFLARLGVEYTVGRVVMVAVLRELGPTLTALGVGARIASGITAELGSMKVTEQIDAMRALGDDPVKRLVTPRLLACAVVLPSLTVIADGLALVAGAVVVHFEYGIAFRAFFSTALDSATFDDFFSGLGKSFFFGLIVAVIGCFNGFQVKGGTEGVGRATTATVSAAAVTVLLADYFLTKLFLFL